MAISRMHPIANWVRLAPHEHRRALDKVLQFRDAAPDPMASGMPEAATAWFWSRSCPGCSPAQTYAARHWSAL
jgi:hypothetical protein